MILPSAHVPSASQQPETVHVQPSKIRISFEELPLHVVFTIVSFLDLTSCITTLTLFRNWAQCCCTHLYSRPVLYSDTSIKSFMQTLSLEQPTFDYRTLVRGPAFNPAPYRMDTNEVKLLSMCPYLLRVSFNKLLSSKVTAETLTDFFNQQRHLVTIDLAAVHQVNDNVAYAIANNCHKLRALDLSKCANLSRLGMVAIFASCSHLRVLKLHFEMGRGRSNGPIDLPDDDDIQALFHKCPNLVEVELLQCAGLGVGLIQTAFSLLPNLSKLSFTRAKPNSTMEIPQWTGRKRHVALLDLSGCVSIDDNAMIAISHTLCSLQRLILSHCRQITDQSLLYLHQSALHNLICVDFEKCNRISAEHAIKFIQSSRDTLQELNLSHCTWLDDASFAQILEGVSTLRRLSINGDLQISDPSMVLIGNQCKSLTKLDLSSNQNVTDVALGFILGNCRHIKAISVGSCAQLNHQAIFAISQYLPGVEKLRITNLGLSSTTVSYLVAHCPRIQRLHLSYNRELTLKTLRDVIFGLPRLVHLSLTGIASMEQDWLQLLSIANQNQDQDQDQDQEGVEAQRRPARTLVLDANSIHHARVHMAGERKEGQTFLEWLDSGAGIEQGLGNDALESGHWQDEIRERSE